MGIILKPFAWLLLAFYNLFNSYGLALILFAIVIKVILFPVTLKTKKSMIQTTLLSGKMQQLQKQYGKDRERYNLEVQKLYEREKVNPMGGCLWSLIPMVVLIALYGIIREPLTYFMNLSMDQIQVLASQLDWQNVAVANGWVSQSGMDKLVEKMASGEISYVFENGAYNQMYLVSLINSSNLSSLQSALNAQFAGAGDGLFVLNFQFLGLDLSKVPTWQFWIGGLTSVGLFLLPLISTVVSFLSMKVSMATNKMNNNQPQNKQMESTNKMMMWMMPLMSIYIAFIVPAALGVYWAAQSAFSIIQEMVLGKFYTKKLQEEEDARQELIQADRQKRQEEARQLQEKQRQQAAQKKSLKEKRQEAQAAKAMKAKKAATSTTEAGRVGDRPYARGRSYKADRYDNQ